MTNKTSSTFVLSQCWPCAAKILQALFQELLTSTLKRSCIFGSPQTKSSSATLMARSHAQTLPVISFSGHENGGYPYCRKKTSPTPTLLNYWPRFRSEITKSCISPPATLGTRIRFHLHHESFLPVAILSPPHLLLYYFRPKITFMGSSYQAQS